jgi:hypothetical protein
MVLGTAGGGRMTWLPVVKLVAAGAGRESVVASFTPMGVPTVLRDAHRAADALGLSFDEDRRRPWLAGGPAE